MALLRGIDGVTTVGPHSFVARLREVASLTAEPIGRQFGSLDKNGMSDGGERYGVSICYINQTGDIPLQQVFGKPDPLKEDRFKQNAFNKCNVMFVNSDDPNCISSWPYRSELSDPPVWGGGIALDIAGGYLACSGYTEPVDELYMLAIAINMGLTSPERDTAIVSASGNNRALLVHMVEKIRQIVLEAN